MTENVRRIEAAKGCSRHPQSHWSMEQIVCQPTLQVTLFALIMCILTVGLVWADYQAGLEAYERGDYETALQEFQPLAESGDSNAQFRLGVMYDNGEGVAQDYGEAFKWYRKAAQQDHAIAQFNLGARYATGKGVVQNYEETIKWYEKAIEQGPAGDQAILGVRYVNGAGIAQDYGKALKCFRKAVEQGNTIAQLYLGSMYEYGTGVDQNYVTAYMWYHRAGTLGIEGALEERDKIAEKMTPAQIAEAQRRAREWKPKKTN